MYRHDAIRWSQRVSARRDNRSIEPSGSFTMHTHVDKPWVWDAYRCVFRSTNKGSGFGFELGAAGLLCWVMIFSRPPLLCSRLSSLAQNHHQQQHQQLLQQHQRQQQLLLQQHHQMLASNQPQQHLQQQIALQVSGVSAQPYDMCPRSLTI